MAVFVNRLQIYTAPGTLSVRGRADWDHSYKDVSCALIISRYRSLA